jgi:hypothetical protein
MYSVTLTLIKWSCHYHSIIDSASQSQSGQAYRYSSTLILVHTCLPFPHPIQIHPNTPPRPDNGEHVTLRPSPCPIMKHNPDFRREKMISDWDIVISEFSTCRSQCKTESGFHVFIPDPDPWQKGSSDQTSKSYRY